MQGIPEDVYRFLVAHIDSVEQLEVLLLLRATEETEWVADSLARMLYSHSSSIARRLDTLHSQGLVTRTGEGYGYGPKTETLRKTISHLAEVYRERRVAVITAIASKPMDNVRAFSDAFRLRKRDEE